ncbi:hypothetical protein MBEBAB_1233 [Brevundimonas abyssalis TAR-001]|uniref:Uncharacterized protein n=1 Tax=Brevundimonas abyssalis TAR-001 TaxID=1391729 RepID=A0A8E0KJ36_9CAUL|nr:hypothetical protein MBEBAB_1233 [Brevundimonas abyssalis TAR-001]
MMDRERQCAGAANACGEIGLSRGPTPCASMKWARKMRD